MGRKMLLIGGGGHCHSVLDSILSLDNYDEIGIIDSTDGSYLGIKVMGTDYDLPQLMTEGWSDAFITVGSVGSTIARRRLFEMARSVGLVIPSIIDPTAIVARGCSIEEGTYIGKHAVVNAGTVLGKCSIINTGAIIEHDCSIDDFSHISPGAVLCGQVRVGSDTHVGAGTVVRHQIIIGDNTIIGAGSVVVKNIPDNVKAYGNPCKVVE